MLVKSDLYMYICIRRDYCGNGFKRATEMEKSHGLLSVSERTRKSSFITQNTTQG